MANEIPVILRGSSARNTFTFPFYESDVDVLYITYNQMGSTVVEKEISDCLFSNNKVAVILSQEDTTRLLPRQKLLVQIRGRLVNGTPILSNIMSAKVEGDLLKEGVI